jgi:hypothetical protein
MSFNEIADFRTALSQLTKSNPGLVKGGWRSVMWVIVSYPDGCFIGEQELADQAGYAKDTVKTYLRELTKLGFILREQKWVRKGIRQCYRINVKAIADFNSVAPDTRYEASSTSIGVTQSVLSLTDSPTAWDLSPTYRYKDKDKYDKTKTNRFTVFRDLLPSALKGLEPGPNLDALLDVLEVKGGRLKALADHLNDHDYTGAESLNSVLFKRLRTYVETLPDRKTTDVQDRLVKDQLEEMHRNQATPEQRAEHIARARKGLGRA